VWGLVAYARGTRCGYFLSLAGFAGALLARETGIVFPALAVLYDVAFRVRLTPALCPPSYPRWGHGACSKPAAPFPDLFELPPPDPLLGKEGVIARYLGFAVIPVLYWIWRTQILGLHTSGAAVHVSLCFRTLTMLKVFGEYVGLLLVPRDLHLARVVDVERTLSAQAAVGLVLVVAAAAIAVWAYRRSGGLFFALGWFFITLAPSANVLVPLQTFMAEHWLYLPSMGWCWAVSLGLAALWRRLEACPEPSRRGLPRRRSALSAAIVGALLGYGVATVRATADWRDEPTLFSRLARLSPESAKVWNHLGRLRLQEQRLPEAQGAFEAALRAGVATAETRAGSYTGLGLVAERRGDLDGATAAYRQAIDVWPASAAAYGNLGNLAFGRGDLDGAIAAYQRSVEIAPSAATVWENLGAALARRGRLAESVDALRRAMALRPEDAELRAKLKKVEEAQQRQQE
jgi:tetratricopeptide (TPR) repeat protein